MAEKRSVPAALGIAIGPASAYLSYLILSLELNEFLQLLCFTLFLLAGHDLARSRISLSGVLTLLLLPSIPVGIYLAQVPLPHANHLGPKMIVALWAASALLGAILAGVRPLDAGKSGNVSRLAILACALLVLVLSTVLLGD